MELVEQNFLDNFLIKETIKKEANIIISNKIFNNENLENYLEIDDVVDERGFFKDKILDL